MSSQIGYGIHRLKETWKGHLDSLPRGKTQAYSMTTASEGREGQAAAPVWGLPQAGRATAEATWAGLSHLHSLPLFPQQGMLLLPPLKEARGGRCQHCHTPQQRQSTFLVAPSNYFVKNEPHTCSPFVQPKFTEHLLCHALPHP